AEAMPVDLVRQIVEVAVADRGLRNDGVDRVRRPIVPAELPNCGAVVQLTILIVPTRHLAYCTEHVADPAHVVSRRGGAGGPDASVAGAAVRGIQSSSSAQKVAEIGVRVGVTVRLVVVGVECPIA